MLIVFLTVFPTALTPGVCLGFCRLFGIGILSCWFWFPDGARSPLFGNGVEYPDVSAMVGIPPVLFLVLFVGNAGKAEVGGPRDGRADRGNDVAIVLVCVVFIKPVLSCVRPYRGVFFMKCCVSTCDVGAAVNAMRSKVVEL